MKNEASIDFVREYYADDFAERNIPESRWALSWLREVRGPAVLSLGCGPNFYDDAFFFAELPRHFTGIDLNRANLEFLERAEHPETLRCKKALQSHGIMTRLVQGDIRKKREEFFHAFDTVYATGVIGMFAEDDLRKIVSLVVSYLKPGGSLVDIDWTDCQLSEEKYRERESYEWFSSRGPDSVKVGQIMEEAGLRILRHGVHQVAAPVAYGWGKIYGYLASL